MGTRDRWSPSVAEIVALHKKIAGGHPSAIESLDLFLSNGVKMEWGPYFHNAVTSGLRDVAARLSGLVDRHVSGPTGGIVEPRDLPKRTQPSEQERMLFGPSLLSAIHMGDVGMVRMLRGKGFATDGAIREAGHVWAGSARLEAKGGEEMLDLISDLGSDMSKPTWGGRQPIVTALATRNVGLAETLLLRGLHKPVAKASNPLNCAITSKRFDLVEWLLGLGENPNKPGMVASPVSRWWSPNGGHHILGGHGELPLTTAIKVLSGADLECVLKMLLAAGANPMEVDGSSGSTPMERADGVALGMLESAWESSRLTRVVSQSERAERERRRKERKAARREAEREGKPKPVEEAPRRSRSRL